MEQKAWNPAELLQLSGGYWSACALHAGIALDIFTPLSEGPMAAKPLAERTGCDHRGLEMLLNSLAALNLLEKRGDKFHLTPFSLDYLSKTSPQYLGHIINHHHHLMESWAQLDQAVKNGGPLRQRVSHDAGDAERESFEMGMFNLAMQLAPRIVPNIDLSERKRLLDLGGGPGTYAIQFCLHNPELTATVYDLPTTRPFAEQTIARFGLTDRIGFESGDFIEEGILGTFDVAWLSHILHGEGPEGCAVILEKAAAALEPGGMLLVQEFILNNSQDGPVFPALFSLNMLLGTPKGKAYSEQELIDLMTAAGADQVQRLPLELPNGAGVMVGYVGEK